MYCEIMIFLRQVIWNFKSVHGLIHSSVNKTSRYKDRSAIKTIFFRFGPKSLISFYSGPAIKTNLLSRPLFVSLAGGLYSRTLLYQTCLYLKWS